MKLSGFEKISIILILVIAFLIFNPFGAAVYSGPAVLDAPQQVNLASPEFITLEVKDEPVQLELLAT